MPAENKKVLVKFNEAATDNVAKGNLVKRGLGITTESRGFYVRTESDEFLFIPSEENLLDDGAARIGISAPTLSGTVKGVLISHQAVIQSLGGLATKTVILNADVSSEAGIAWSKISKLGAVASDVGAAPVVDGKIPSQYIPAVALTDIFEVASEAAMLALNAQLGDYAIRTDSNEKYMLKAEPATVLANWLLINDGGAVLSVDGRTGVVTLDDLYKDIAWTPNWADINDKPLTFTPSSHTHVWADITDKPLTFTPSAHSHLISDVTNLQSALDGKQPLNDFLSALSGFSSESNGFIRVSAGNLNVDQSTYSLSSHSHNTLGAVTFTDAISGTSGTFNGDVSAGSFTEGGVALATKYAVAGHTHTDFGTITLSGNLRFGADNAYDIGQVSARVRNAYVMDLSATYTVYAGNTVGAPFGMFGYIGPTGTENEMGGPGARWSKAYFVDFDASGIINAGTLRQGNVDVSTLFATAGHNHNGVYAPLASPTFTGTVTIEDGSIRNTSAGVVRFGNKNRAETEGFTHSSNGLVVLEAGNSLNLNAVGFINLATANSATTGLRFISDKVLYGISGGLRTNGTFTVDGAIDGTGSVYASRQDASNGGLFVAKNSANQTRGWFGFPGTSAHLHIASTSGGNQVLFSYAGSGSLRFGRSDTLDGALDNESLVIADAGIFATKTHANGNVGTAIRMESALPNLRWSETDAPADEKIWDLRADGGDLYLITRNDADTSGADIAKFTRGTGTAYAGTTFYGSFSLPNATLSSTALLIGSGASLWYSSILKSDSALGVTGVYYGAGGNTTPDPNIDGSWRVYADGSGNLITQKRVSGSWVTKQTITG